MKPSDLLTRRELEILSLREQGLPIKQIAAALGISVSTVKFHLGHVLAKTKTLCSLAAIHTIRLQAGVSSLAEIEKGSPRPKADVDRNRVVSNKRTACASRDDSQTGFDH